MWIGPDSSEDPSKYPTLPCDECGARVRPEVEIREAGFGIDWEASGSIVKWVCEKCGHAKVLRISAEVTDEEVEELERQEEDSWRLQHQEDKY